LSQVADAYRGIAELAEPLHSRHAGGKLPLTILNGTAAYLEGVEDSSIDIICMDPPYYNNVQYAELSDYFYVWQSRTLKALYPEQFASRLTNKSEEAVANPFRAKDGQELEKAEAERLAQDQYHSMMADIFRECGRVLRDDGRMTLMFTHKEQAAWTALTRAL